MKPAKLIGLSFAALSLLTVATLAVIYFSANSKQGTDVVNLRGTVTNINNGCWADGTCSITLDNTKTIITGCGLRADNTSCAAYDQSRLHIGDKVAAKVLKADESYNLECQGCTIHKQ